MKIYLTAILKAKGEVKRRTAGAYSKHGRKYKKSKDNFVLNTTCNKEQRIKFIFFHEIWEGIQEAIKNNIINRIILKLLYPKLMSCWKSRHKYIWQNLIS